MKLFLSIFFLFLLCVSCENNSESVTEIQSMLNKINLVDSCSRNSEININILHFGNNGCCSYSRYASTISQDTFIITMFQKMRSKKGMMCTMNLPIFETNLSIKPIKNGWNYFKFTGIENQIISDSTWVY